MHRNGYDVAIVGAGIVGLAHALAAARRGKRVLVIDRDAQANGASIRNFGFVTVTGQERGLVWQRAMRTSRIWSDLAAEAGIAVVHRGLLMAARRADACDVLDAFLATEMGTGCTRLSAADVAHRLPFAPPASGGLWSPHDLRVESREAIPQLAQWLETRWQAEFRRGLRVTEVREGRVTTTGGAIAAESIIVCPGDDFSGLYPDVIAAHALVRCQLQMLRLAAPGYRLPGSVMSDLSLVRYLGYAALPQSTAVAARLRAEQPDHLANGIHLIVVQSADGSLVVGDSHHYAATPPPFASEAVDRLILDEFAAVLGPAPALRERWTGTYASGPEQCLIEAPEPGVRLVIVTSGSGASTSFAIAEDVMADLYG
ncbi:TIGR03364 family FAD-dependent oxidoreductase [Novosphingobium sp. Chol11]|uniref:TIGR03364 family FAD-dependent oxidoreductase n=1 Tax=Novosphingobium sp. Chol11 TaxID=1385763 RepID=UPI0025DE086C|nr:TIGR03364 family FAD-dependent oxidoreductase [Novosphingobium sp. Chol11]